MAFDGPLPFLALQQYLLGIPLRANYLEEGLEKLGISAEDADSDVL